MGRAAGLLVSAYGASVLAAAGGGGGASSWNLCKRLVGAGAGGPATACACVAAGVRWPVGIGSGLLGPYLGAWPVAGLRGRALPSSQRVRPSWHDVVCFSLRGGHSLAQIWAHMGLDLG